MTTPRHSWLIAVSVGVVALMPVVLAQTAVFTTVDYPGAARTAAFGINSQGDIVGGYINAAGDEHGFALVNGAFSSFDWPGATWTEAKGINPRGDIVGQYGWAEDGLFTVHGFLLRDGVMSSIDIPGMLNTMPEKISPEGTIVGCYHVMSSLNTMFGYVLNAAGDITSQSIGRTMNNGVNADGDVVGLYYSPISGRVEQSYLIRDGVQTMFQFPGSYATQAWDINARGTIVGWHRSSTTGSPQYHGFVMEDGEMTSFDVPGASATWPMSINALGDIVGYYNVPGGGAHGFLKSHGSD